MGHTNPLEFCRPLTSCFHRLVNVPKPVDLNANPVWVTPLGLEKGPSTHVTMTS